MDWARLPINISFDQQSFVCLGHFKFELNENTYVCTYILLKIGRFFNHSFQFYLIHRYVLKWNNIYLYLSLIPSQFWTTNSYNLAFIIYELAVTTATKFVARNIACKFANYLVGIEKYCYKPYLVKSLYIWYIWRRSRAKCPLRNWTPSSVCHASPETPGWKR